jgi:hypothetical protein
MSLDRRTIPAISDPPLLSPALRFAILWTPLVLRSTFVDASAGRHGREVMAPDEVCVPLGLAADGQQVAEDHGRSAS